MKDTLKFRFSMYITLTILLVGALLAFTTLYKDWQEHKMDFTRHGLTVAERVALLSADEILREDNLAIFNKMESVIKSENNSRYGRVAYMEVLDKAARPMATVEDGFDKDEKARVAADRGRAASVTQAAVRTYSVSARDSLIDTTYPLVLDGVRIGTVRVGMSDKLLTAAFYNAVVKALGMLLAACFIGVFMGGRIAGWVSRPIMALVAGTEEFSKGNLEHRVEVNGPRELSLLGERLNQMAGSLREKVEWIDRSKMEAEGLSSELANALDDSKQAALRLRETNEWVTDLAFRLEEANQSLKAEKVQTDTIVHSIREGIVALDANENVILLNPEAEEIFDVREEDVKGAPVQVLVNRLTRKVDDPEEFLRNFMAASSSPDTENIFSVTLTRPFKRVLRRLSSAIRDDKGNVIGRVVTFRDVTREKEVDDLKTNFISTVSHELRTPLTSIKGAINLLLEGQVDEPETRHEFLRIAEQNTDRLISLITSLLDLSQIEEGRVRMKFGRVDINPIVRSVLKSTSVLVKQSGVKIKTDGLGQPLQVMGDKEKIEQVVTNLLGNAIKFSDPGNTVEVKTAMVDEEVRIIVEDEGPGIPRDKLDRVFDKFYQVDMTATRRKGGTGLGLTISKAIVKEHGGKIWAESPVSQDGRGARFIVSLPRLAVEDAGREPYPSRPVMVAHPPLRAERNDNTVLMVDTDPEILKVHKRVFEHEGFRIVTATTGREALSAARDTMPGFIFLDVHLPDLDGFVVASILRGDEVTREIPIIFTTSLDEDGRQRCMTLGDGYVIKPFQEDDLISVVRNIIK